jgi:hypothetical protein
MSFREKSAWITLLTVVVCFGAYFGALLTGLVHRGFSELHLLLVCVLALAVLQVGLGFIAARTTPTDGRAPRDEREILIQARSHSIGYHVLLLLVLALGIPVHLGRDAVDVMNFALLDVVLAVAVVAIAQIVMFRRGY